MTDNAENIIQRGPDAGKPMCMAGKVPQPFGPNMRWIGDWKDKCRFPAVEGSQFCKLHDPETNARLVEERLAKQQAEQQDGVVVEDGDGSA